MQILEESVVNCIREMGALRRCNKLCLANDRPIRCLQHVKRRDGMLLSPFIEVAFAGSSISIVEASDESQRYMIFGLQFGVSASWFSHKMGARRWRPGRPPRGAGEASLGISSNRDVNPLPPKPQGKRYAYG